MIDQRGLLAQYPATVERGNGAVTPL